MAVVSVSCLYFRLLSPSNYMFIPGKVPLCMKCALRVCHLICGLNDSNNAALAECEVELRPESSGASGEEGVCRNRTMEARSGCFGSRKSVIMFNETNT